MISGPTAQSYDASWLPESTSWNSIPDAKTQLKTIQKFTIEYNTIKHFNNSNNSTLRLEYKIRLKRKYAFLITAPDL